METKRILILCVVVLAGVVAVGRAALCFPDPSSFLEPVPAPIDWILGYQGDGKPYVTPDGQMMSFIRYTPHQVHTAEWNEAEQRWDNITHVTGLGQTWTSASCFSPDKQWLYYVGSSGSGGDIYRSQWLVDHWGPGQPIDAVNTAYGDDFPFFDGNRLYFASDRNSVWDIYYSEYDPVEDTFGEPVPLNSINTSYGDGAPRVTGDGQTLLFNSDRLGGYGGMDIWMASWDSETEDWINVTNLGPAINDSRNQAYPSYASATDTLYFLDYFPEGEYCMQATVPEPSTLLLLAPGLLGFAGVLRKRLR